MEFQAWGKTPRLNRQMVVTEKLDGTNAAVVIAPAEGFAASDPDVIEIMEVDGVDHVVCAQSRKRFITPESDNFGFARWVSENAPGLVEALGPGTHFGEWWGQGIQRGYGLKEKRFSLFNTNRWEYNDPRHEGVPGLGTVPVLFTGLFDSSIINDIVTYELEDSYAAPGFNNPEGVVVWHDAARQSFKVLKENDDIPKGNE